MFSFLFFFCCCSPYKNPSFCLYDFTFCFVFFLVICIYIIIYNVYRVCCCCIYSMLLLVIEWIRCLSTPSTLLACCMYEWVSQADSVLWNNSSESSTIIMIVRFFFCLVFLSYLAYGCLLLLKSWWNSDPLLDAVGPFHFTLLNRFTEGIFYICMLLCMHDAVSIVVAVTLRWCFLMLSVFLVFSSFCSFPFDSCNL